MLNNPNVYGQIGMDVFFKMRYGRKPFFKEKTLFRKIENRCFQKFSASHKIGVRKKPLIFDYKKGGKVFLYPVPDPTI